MLSRRSNGEKQIFNFSGLSLSRQSNSEEQTRFRTAADTVFENRPFLCNRMQQKNVLFSETYSFDRNLLFDFMCVAWLSARKKSTRKKHVKVEPIEPPCLVSKCEWTKIENWREGPATRQI